MLKVIGIYIGLFIMAAFPFNLILTWVFKQQKKPTTLIHYAIQPTLYFFKQFIITGTAFGLLTISSLLLFYENDSFFYISVSLITISYFWSAFNKWQANDTLLYFFIGILSFFNVNFLWFFPLLFILSTFIFNSPTAGYLVALISSYPTYLIFDTSHLFLTSHTIIVALFILKYQSQILNLFSLKQQTLLHLFNTRNTP